MDKREDEQQSVEYAPTPEKNSQDIKNLEKDLEDNSTLGVAPPEREHITGAKLWILIGSVTLVTFLMLLDMTIVTTAIPQITSDFHALDDVGWYASVYMMSACALQPLTGKIYTHFNVKFTFLSFLALFELGSVLCGAAKSSIMLIIGRVIAGLGSSGLINGALTIISSAAPLHKQPLLIGTTMSISQLGVLGGPLIGGALTQYSSWRWCFYINLPIGAVSAAVLFLIRIPYVKAKNIKDDTEKPTTFSILSKLDLVGFFFFAVFSTMLMLGLEWGGNDYSWNSATVIGLLCGAAGTFVVFCAWEHRMGDGAMIPFSMMRITPVWSACMVALTYFGALVIFSYYLPIYFQSVKGTSPALSGVYLLPGLLGQMAMLAVTGVILGKMGYYLLWSVASGVIVAIAAGLISTFTPHTSTVKWVMYQLIGGIGRGCGMQMPILAIQNNLPPQQISMGMAMAVFLQTFGGSISMTIAQAIFSHSLASGLKKYAPTVETEVVITAGATAIRKVVKPEELAGVLEAYNSAINNTFYLAVGGAVAAFAFSWGMGWHKIAKKGDTTKAQTKDSDY